MPNIFGKPKEFPEGYEVCGSLEGLRMDLDPVPGAYTINSAFIVPLSKPRGVIRKMKKGGSVKPP